MVTLVWGIIVQEGDEKKTVLQWNKNIADVAAAEAEIVRLKGLKAFKDRFACLIFDDKGQVVHGGTEKNS